MNDTFKVKSIASSCTNSRTRKCLRFFQRKEERQKCNGGKSPLSSFLNSLLAFWLLWCKNKKQKKKQFNPKKYDHMHTRENLHVKCLLPICTEGITARWVMAGLRASSPQRQYLNHSRSGPEAGLTEVLVVQRFWGSELICLGCFLYPNRDIFCFIFCTLKTSEHSVG